MNQIKNEKKILQFLKKHKALFSVRLHDTFANEDSVGLVFELVEGLNLYQIFVH